MYLLHPCTLQSPLLTLQRFPLLHFSPITIVDSEVPRRAQKLQCASCIISPRGATATTRQPPVCSYSRYKYVRRAQTRSRQIRWSRHRAAGECSLQQNGELNYGLSPFKYIAVVSRQILCFWRVSQSDFCRVKKEPNVECQIVSFGLL